MEHDIASLVEYVRSDVLLRFAETKPSAMSRKAGRSLSQEFQGVTPSRRRILLSRKSQLTVVLGPGMSSPMERHLAERLGIHDVSAAELKILTEQIAIHNTKSTAPTGLVIHTHLEMGKSR
jgi:hypothetical protein